MSELYTMPLNNTQAKAGAGKKGKGEIVNIYQTSLINSLTKVSNTQTVIKGRSKYYTFSNDILAEIYTTKYKNLTLCLSATVDPQKVRTSMHQLTDALIIRCTEKCNIKTVKDLVATISLQEYMDLRDLKDEKATREQVNEDLNTLYHLYYMHKSGQFRVISGYDFKNGIISVTFAPEFLALLQRSSIMRFPTNLLRIDVRSYPNAYYIGRRVVEHKRMNLCKPNESIIAIKTLCEATPCLPDSLHVGRHQTEKIIEPFERDMDACIEYGILKSWEYCHTKGEPLTDEELQNMDINLFYSLLVKFETTFEPTAEERKKISSKKNTKKTKNSEKKLM